MEMKKKVSKLRLSPNEEARLIREEHERRRKLRIQQVREQQRYIALHIRQEVEQRRQKELEKLGDELKADWERQQREKLDTLQKLYQESLQLIGQGHRSAKENEPDLAAIAQREEENQVKAAERHREALKELKSQKLKDHERQSRSLNARRKALQAEKERSARVASLPPPPPNPIQDIDSKKSHVVKKSDLSVFAATHYHMPESTVDREEDTVQPDAHEEAELEVRRLEDLQREKQRRREEQLERARLRGRQALRREHLVQDRERLLVELEHMQQTDLLRRRQQVAHMPPQIFQPLYRRQETREDFQREMEFAFEDMYTGERRVKGDLVVQLVPEPLPALSTGSQDQELDVTQDDITTPGIENAQREAESNEQETSSQEVPSKPAPRRALKKLLDRIRSQRNQWVDQNSCVPAADPPAVITDQIPERDTTIDTGSLTSEEKGSPAPVQLPDPDSSPSAESASADPPHPDRLFNRIQKFEEERKKREKELEREKQQQVVLLRELEEQKAKLEQMLLEAQQEREHLKASVTQEVPVRPPEVPVQDQEFTSVTPGQVSEVIPPSGEDGHTSRIREYQQRLLEQNRIHQRSVQVARQRLEEYQRALRIRYNMAATSFLPAVPPPGLIHPPPPSLQLPTAPPVSVNILPEPQTSEEVPTRESDVLSSPPCHTGSSSRAGSRSLSEEVESISHRSSDQREDVTARLTDSIMERVTRHLTEREKSSAITTEPQPNKPFTTRLSSSASLQSTSNQSIRDEVPVCPSESPGVSVDDMERQRRELQEVQRRFLEHREFLALQQRRQEERQRQEEEREQMRRQKEALQALIQADAPPVPAAASEVLASENISQTRLRILASLLRAIEENNEGTLSRLEEDEEEEDSSAQHHDGETDSIPQSDIPAEPLLSVLSPVFLPPPRAAKPPVTRVRPGVMQMMTEQHELSAIQEVETPVNVSLVAGPEESVPLDAAGWEEEDSESSLASDRSLQAPSLVSRGQQTSERSSSHQAWRERLLTGAGTSPESSESDSVLRMISPLSSDSGRGADFSGPAVTSFRSPTEAAHRPPDSDCLSSTTISTGSYVTTDPELNFNTDKSPSFKHFAQREQSTGLLDVSPPSVQSVVDRSAAAHPGPAVDSLFNDSSIQCIIDRYTRELNISLSTTGKTTDSEGSSMEDPGPSVSQQSLVSVSERSRDTCTPGSSAHQSPPSDTAAAQGRGLERNNPVLEHSALEDPSLAEEQDSFRPLIGQLADQSSCLTADHRDSTMEQLVGQPSAQSSMIAQPPVLSVSLDQGGWDSTLMRMIGRLSFQSSSHWLSGGQDFYAGQLIGGITPEQSTTWLDGGLEESRMRPLVGELDESAGQHSGSSGEKTHVDLGVSTEASLPSYPLLPPEASSHSASVPGSEMHSQEQTLQSQTSPTELGPEQTEVSVFQDSASFHPLLAEETHNETADPSMTFHHPEHSLPNSPEGLPVSTESSVSDPSVESEPSPERLRAEEPSSCAASSVLHESFSQLQLHESELMVSPTMRTDVDVTALSLTRLSMCDGSPSEVRSHTEEEETETTCISKKNEDSVKFSDECSGDLESEQGSNQTSVALMIMDAASQKGILEQSEITLVSLTDTTLQDQETTLTDEEDIWEEKNPDGVREEGPRGPEMEESESMLLNETSEDKNQEHPGLLEIQWGPTESQQEVCQQKCKALLQRSSRRVEEIKAKAARAKKQPKIQVPSKARERPAAQEPQQVTCRAKTKPEGLTKTKRNPPEQHRAAETSGFNNQKKPQHAFPVSESRLTELEVKLCTPEQRKRDVSEMHQRTQRLYEQLEEVKHQKAMRGRQDANAKNRLKAKEFHKKTLQKLRAKQTPL
ncbi:centrosomal protein of 295 kDa isoform X2 [Notolabrus celidotus]|uniref:centrosomal protein of 295 kDa isoform X2 n=1 Tax=Notolabrus celidotus TaxID=1203425 RepID=UPI00149043A7|nr:centrosomal protein of 295 kDa isoform X2 [Notolabrus celidotus]